MHLVGLTVTDTSFSQAVYELLVHRLSGCSKSYCAAIWRIDMSAHDMTIVLSLLTYDPIVRNTCVVIMSLNQHLNILQMCASKIPSSQCASCLCVKYCSITASPRGLFHIKIHIGVIQSNHLMIEADFKNFTEPTWCLLNGKRPPPPVGVGWRCITCVCTCRTSALLVYVWALVRHARCVCLTWIKAQTGLLMFALCVPLGDCCANYVCFA